MVDYLTDALIAKGIKVVPINLADGDLGDLAMSLVDAANCIFGASMVLMGPHPDAVSAAYVAIALRPKTKFVSAIGSYGWAVAQGEKWASKSYQ